MPAPVVSVTICLYNASLSRWRSIASTRVSLPSATADITLPEHRDLRNPIRRSASYPEAVRLALGDALLGQHRIAARHLLHQGRYRLAAKAVLGMCRYPDRVRDSVRIAPETAGQYA